MSCGLTASVTHSACPSAVSGACHAAFFDTSRRRLGFWHFPDQSRFPNPRVRLDEARGYLFNDAIDFDIRVLKGRCEIVAPKLKGQERFRVGTP